MKGASSRTVPKSNILDPATPANLIPLEYCQVSLIPEVNV